MTQHRPPAAHRHFDPLGQWYETHRRTAALAANGGAAGELPLHWAFASLESAVLSQQHLIVMLRGAGTRRESFVFQALSIGWQALHPLIMTTAPRLLQQVPAASFEAARQQAEAVRARLLREGWTALSHLAGDDEAPRAGASTAAGASDWF